MREERKGRTLTAAITLGAVFVVLAFGQLRRRPDAPPPPPPEPPHLRVKDAAPRAASGPELRGRLGDRRLSMPIPGLPPSALRDMFDENHFGHRHEALDLLAPQGTPVLAIDDGVVAKLFVSKPGGITVYQFDPTSTWCYYYAHLDRWADGLREGQTLRRGDVIGYVGTTGNAPKNTPHLHLAISRLGPEKRWWTGTPIDPYPLLKPS